jgi:hypothetical protein
MTMHARLVTFCVITAMTACMANPSAPEHTGTSSLAITSGTVDDGDAAVVALLGSDGAPYCSGTLISPHVVLTAAHCVASQVTVAFGADAGSPTATIAVATMRADPAYQIAASPDVALAVLVDAAPSAATPVAILAPGAGALAPGASARIVGFGQDGPGGAEGTKRSGATTITAVLAGTITIGADPSVTCGGDSGGPLLVSVGGVDYLAGATSSGDLDCSVSSTFSRVDTLASGFILPFVAAVESPAALGAPCYRASQCATGSCAQATDDPRIHYCSPACSGGQTCPSGMTCSEGQCLYAAPTPGALTSPCSTDTDCEDGLCSAAAGSRCATRCFPMNSPACPSDLSCVVDDELGASVCAAPVTPATGHACSLAFAARGSRGAELLLVTAAVLARRRRARRP